MRLISLLIGLVLIAFLISKQLASDSPSRDIAAIIEEDGISLPKVPVSPKDLKAFEADMNAFIENAASERKEELEKALNQ